MSKRLKPSNIPLALHRDTRKPLRRNGIIMSTVRAPLGLLIVDALGALLRELDIAAVGGDLAGMTHALDVRQGILVAAEAGEFARFGRSEAPGAGGGDVAAGDLEEAGGEDVDEEGTHDGEAGVDDDGEGGFDGGPHERLGEGVGDVGEFDIE